MEGADGTKGRTSMRSNKGVPPDRLGFEKFSTDVGTVKNVQETAGSSRESIASTNSGRSMRSSVPSSTASTIKKQEIELRSIEETNILLREEVELLGRKSNRTLKVLNEELTALKDPLNPNANTEENKQAIADVMKKVDSTMAVWEDKEVERMENQKKMIELRAIVETQKVILEEENEQFLGSDEEKVFEVDGENSADDSTDSEEDDPVAELEERLRQLKKPTSQGRRPKSPPKRNRVKVSGPPPNKDKMDLFLARQSIRQELPVFDGKVEGWPIFFSQFTMTTEACGLTDVENLQRLQKSLKGAARITVQSMLVAASNVKKIMSVLEQRYGNPKAILENILSQVRKIPTVKSGDDGAMLLLVDSVRNLTATAVAFKCEPYIQNPQLIDELVKKLPDFRRDMWCERVRKKKIAFPSLVHLSDWLEQEGAKVCVLYNPSASTSNSSAKSGTEERGSHRRSNGKERVYVASAEAEAKPTGQGNPQNCDFCHEAGHRVSKCPKFKDEDVKARWKWIRKSRNCFACLLRGHSVNDCKSKRKCDQKQCGKFHHSLLHAERMDESASPGSGAETSSEAEVVTVATRKNYSSGNVKLMIVPVKLKGPKGIISTYAMLDSGSTITLLNSDMAEGLGVEGKSQPLVYDGLHPTAVEQTSMTVDLEVLSFDGKKRFFLKNVKTIDRALPFQTVKRSVVEKNKHLMGIKDLYCETGQPTILIGMDNAQITLSDKVIRGGPNGPYAARTELGWVLAGRVAEGSNANYNFLIQDRDESLHQMVKHYFSTESFGVKVTDRVPRSRDDSRALAILEATSRRVADRWESGLLWRHEDISLPESRINALSRLKSIEAKLDKNAELAEWYVRKLAEYEQKGYIQKLTEDEAAVTGPRTWYLPHFVAYHPNKPDKPRLVFDAASKSRGVSLNDNLLTGPDLVSPLPTVLYKFRQRKYAVTADISEMFLQVRRREEDRASQRFLWRGSDWDRDPDTYQLLVTFFGAASSPCTAQFVKNRNAGEFREEFPEAYRAIVERHYVDDYLDSADTCEEAKKLVEDVTEVHRRGGFKICNWMVNHAEVLESVPVESRASSLKDLSPNSELPSGRVLGLWWNPEEDKFMWKFTFNRVKPEVLNGTEIPTKREVLRLVMSLFDPLGFLAHFTVKAKIMLQSIWRSGIGWDDQIPDIQCEKWKTWLCELKRITNMKIPRCYSSHFSTCEYKQLHIFCDASELAFCAVAFWRIETESEVETAFVTAKTHVAPLKPMSIPRLELQAAVMAVRLGGTIRDGHDIPVENVHFWSDSRTVLCWLRADGKRFLQFVAHRVGEIQESTDPRQWHWVPTLENVADDGTRDSKECDFSEHSRWLNGPAFLKRPPEEWPVEKLQLVPDDEELELKKEFIGLCVPTEPILRPEDYSSWTRLVRVTAWVFRFVNKTKKKHSSVEGASEAELLPHEIRNSEKFWWKKSQSEDFRPEVHCLAKGKAIPKDSSLIKLSPMLDAEGMLRMRGRLGDSIQAGDEFKNPIILNRKNQITRLLIRHYHEKTGHHGMEKVVNELKQEIFIPSLRVAVRSAWSSCQKCKNSRAKPVVPEMGELPAYRQESHVRPFTSTGVDYFGPLYVTVRRSHEKRYGVLFTCMSTRAVHMEVAGSLTTDSCIMAIRRFAARRGQPKRIFSDNGTNLVGAEKELREALRDLDQERIQAEMTMSGTEWHFIPPLAPHMGGCWERLVKSVKIALGAILKERFPKEELLHTLLLEAEHIVNSRPLTHVSVDPDDPEALTPNHFLLGAGGANPAPGGDDDLWLRKQWRTAQRLADMFWKRWVHEYLPTLTRRTKWHEKKDPVKVGDVVVVADDALKRNCWPMG